MAAVAAAEATRPSRMVLQLTTCQTRSVAHCSSPTCQIRTNSLMMGWARTRRTRRAWQRARCRRQRRRGRPSVTRRVSSLGLSTIYALRRRAHSGAWQRTVSPQHSKRPSGDRRARGPHRRPYAQRSQRRRPSRQQAELAGGRASLMARDGNGDCWHMRASGRLRKSRGPEAAIVERWALGLTFGWKLMSALTPQTGSLNHSYPDTPSSVCEGDSCGLRTRGGCCVVECCAVRFRAHRG